MYYGKKLSVTTCYQPARMLGKSVGLLLQGCFYINTFESIDVFEFCKFS
jgi:hypothetical protein